MPLTTQRWAMRKTTRVGSKAMRYDAKATLKFVVNWSWNRYWTTGRVCYFGFAVISCGIMKSFQDCRKAKMPTVAADRRQQRQHDLPEGLPGGAAVHPRALLQLDRDGPDEGGEEQHVEGQLEHDVQDRDAERVSQADRGHELDLRQRDDGERNEQGGQQVDERRAELPVAPVTHDRPRRERTHQDLPGHGDHRDQQAHRERQRGIGQVPGGPEVPPVNRPGEVEAGARAGLGR